MTEDFDDLADILQMRGITKTFPGVKALQDVNLSVRRGEIHAICGENGAGKSTLMKVLSGVYPHGSYEGEILFDGEPCAFANIRDSEQRGIVIIHQELALCQQLSIAENIFLGNEQATRGLVDWNRTNHAAAQLLARVGLRENPVTPVLDIGVGKQQLVEIAKALSKEVKLLILDEPTAALNDDDSAHLLDLLRGLKAQGITCVIISHKLNEIAAVADSLTIIRDGRTIETLDMRAGNVTEDRIISGMVGRDLEHRFPPHESHVGAEVLRIEDWTVHSPTQPDRVVVAGANLVLRAGEIVGLAGLMGAGRTELAMSVFGRSYGVGISGRLVKDGEPIEVRSVADAIRHRIAYATEDRKRYGLNLIDDIKRNVSAARLHKLARRGWVDDNEEYRVAEGFRRSMNIKAPTVASITGKLSGGNQQKVVLSKWIFTDPDVLILDEPTRGIDVGAKYEIYTIINRLADEGKAVLVISSELPELLGVCDRIYALSAGRITGELDRADATQERLMQFMTQAPVSQEIRMTSIAPTDTDAQEAPPAGPPRRSPRRFSFNPRQSGIYVAFALIIVLFTVLTDGALLQPQNISNIIVQNSYILILAIGMILIIIAGHIDLSAGSVVAATGAISAVLMVNLHVAWPLAVLVTIVVGAAIGAFQGYWVAYFGIPAFIVTLAGMLVFRAVTLTILGNQGIGPFPDAVRTLSNGFLAGFLGNIGLGPLGGADLFTLLVGLAGVGAIAWTQWRARAARLGYGQVVDPLPVFVLRIALAALVVMFVIVQLARFKNLPWVLVLLAVLVIGYSLLTNRAVFGRHIYAVGGNLQAATLSGVKVKQVTFWIFVNMGVLAAIAGVIFAGRLNQAGPTAGTSFELDAIAAAFIGGAAVQGGVGKVVGAITGGLIMAVINNGMSLIGAPSERVMLVKGLVLLAAVAYDVWTKRRAGAAAR